MILSALRYLGFGIITINVSFPKITLIRRILDVTVINVMN